MWLLLPIVVLLTVLPGLPAFDLVYADGADPDRTTILLEAGEQAEALVAAGVVPEAMRTTTEHALQIHIAQNQRAYGGYVFGDADVSAFRALNEQLRAERDALIAADQRFLLATVPANHVAMMRQRARELHGSDDVEHWRLPEDQHDPDRRYTHRD